MSALDSLRKQECRRVKHPCPTPNLLVGWKIISSPPMAEDGPGTVRRNKILEKSQKNAVWKIYFPSSHFLILIFLPTACWGFPRGNSSPPQRQFNVTREYNNGDSFAKLDSPCLPSFCERFGAKMETDLRCSCRCPVNRAIFLQNTQNCTDTVGMKGGRINLSWVLWHGLFCWFSDVCNKVLEFRAENETLKKAPTLFLPLQYQILNPGAQLNWEGMCHARRHFSVSPRTIKSWPRLFLRTRAVLIFTEDSKDLSSSS